jgi:predicted nucleic acid-binding Zn ribbon protein
LRAALEGLVEDLAPATPLARVQRCWPQLVTALAVAGEAAPTMMRDGVLTVTCTASVYAHELHLMTGDVIAALNAALGEEVVEALRVRSG